MTAHARLKNEFTEDKNYHNLMSWLSYTHKRYLVPCSPEVIALVPYSPNSEVLFPNIVFSSFSPDILAFIYLVPEINGSVPLSPRRTPGRPHILSLISGRIVLFALGLLALEY